MKILITSVKLFLILCCIAHFVIITFHLLPSNPINHQFKQQIERYTFPLFNQSWNLFAPNPANTNSRIMIRFKSYENSDSTICEWVDIVKPYLDKKHGFFWSPAQRILKSMSTITINVQSTRLEAFNYAQSVDSLKNDSLKTANFVINYVDNSAGTQAIKQYSRYVLKNLKENSLIKGNSDSIFVQYRLHDRKFPRFSKRKEDYYDDKNSETSDLIGSWFKMEINNEKTTDEIVLMSYNIRH